MRRPRTRLVFMVATLAVCTGGCAWFSSPAVGLQLEFSTLELSTIDRYLLTGPYDQVVDQAVRRLGRDGVALAERRETKATFSAAADSTDEDSSATLVLRYRAPMLHVYAKTRAEVTFEDSERLSRARRAVATLPGVGIAVDVDGVPVGAPPGATAIDDAVNHGGAATRILEDAGASPNSYKP